MKYAVYVGRFNPIHAGHTAVADEMFRLHGFDGSLIVIGSSNAQSSLRHFFSYEERKNFLKKIFPEARIVGLPDYGNDQEWLSALDDILSATGMKPEEVTFFGGCEEDLRFFGDTGRPCHILNRFDGTTAKISATEIRDALILGRSLEGMIHPAIADDLQTLFKDKWEKFKRT